MTTPSPVRRAFAVASLLSWGIGTLTHDALASAGLIGCVLLALASARRGSVGRVLRGWWPLWLWLGWSVAAPLLAGRWPTGEGLARLGDWAALPAAVWAFGQTNARDRRLLAYGWAAVFSLSCVAAGLQHFGVWPAREWFAPLRWTGFPFDRVYEPVRGFAGRFNAGGLTFHRLKFAHAGGLLLVWALAIGWAERGRARLVAAGVLAAGLASIFLFAQARAAAASIGATLVLVFVVLYPDKRRALLGGAAIAAVMAALVLGYAPLRDRFLRMGEKGSHGDRHLLARTGQAAVADHPVAGLGAGRFSPRRYALHHYPSHIWEHGGKSHNQLLTFAAETGVPGMLAFVWLLAWLARRFLVSAAGVARAAGLGLLVFFSVLSGVHDPLFHAQFSMGLVLALGAALAGLKPRAVRRRTTPRLDAAPLQHAA